MLRRFLTASRKDILSAFPDDIVGVVFVNGLLSDCNWDRNGLKMWESCGWRPIALRLPPIVVVEKSSGVKDEVRGLAIITYAVNATITARRK